MGISRLADSETTGTAATSPGPAGGFTYSGVDNLEAMTHANRYNAYLLDLIRKNLQGSTVLDFGAGAGTFAKPLMGAERSVICVEPDQGLRDGLSSAGFESFASLSDVPPECADTIYSLNVLEHIEDDSGAIAELHKRLKIDGRLILYVPACQVLYSAMDRRVGHFRRYRRPELIGQLRNAGFEVRTARYVDSLGFLVTLLYKLIGDSSGLISDASVKIYDRFVFPPSRVVDALTGGSFGKNLFIVADR